ncbi:hypothetical protein Dimus_025116 [Dionaea muscipula]
MEPWPICCMGCLEHATLTCFFSAQRAVNNDFISASSSCICGISAQRMGLVVHGTLAASLLTPEHLEQRRVGSGSPLNESSERLGHVSHAE